MFLHDGVAPREGDLFRNPGLARAYGLLADQGPSAFYGGEIGAAILRTSQAMGGAMSAEDLACYSAEWVEPISVDYRGWRVYELPPNGQGLAVLQMLNIMEAFPVAPEGAVCATELHKRIEAMKLAYADAWRYNGDPRTSRIPLRGLLAKDYGRLRARAIDPVRANPGVRPGLPASSDTVYLAVVDREGNIASWIQSIYAGFGSGIVADGMGFTLQNRGAGFTLDPEHPNVLAGGEASVSHDHSGVHGTGRRARWLRHHGRCQSAAGACAVCFKRSGLRDESAEGAGGTEVFPGKPDGVRCLD